MVVFAVKSALPNVRIVALMVPVTCPPVIELDVIVPSIVASVLKEMKEV